MSEIQIILSIQSISNSTFDMLFKAITNLGSETFYMLIIPIIYWCFSKKNGFRLALLFSLSAFVNLTLKAFFHLPRPSDPSIKMLYKEAAAGTVGFPSAHSQGTTTFWSYVVSQAKKRFLLYLGVILVTLVSLSRVYLGLHYLHDVIGGILVGLVVTFIFVKIYNIIGKRLMNLSLPVKITISVCLPLLLFALYHTPNSAKVFGLLVGMGVGSTLENRYIGFVERASLKIQFLKGLIGLVVLFIIRVMLKEVFPSVYSYDLLRYTAMGLWIFFFAPFVFSQFLQENNGTMFSKENGGDMLRSKYFSWKKRKGGGRRQ